MLTPRGVVRRRVAALEGKLRGDRLAGPLVDHLAVGLVADDFVERLGSLHRCAGDHAVAALRILGEIHLSEKGSRLKILVLRPALEGMVVALVAVEPHAQKEVGRVFHGGCRIAERLEVGGGRVLPVGAGGGEDVAGKLVIGRVGGDLVADPLPQAVCALGAEELRVHLQQVGPLVGPVLDERIARQEPAHEFMPLRAGVAGIGEEGPHVCRRRRQAGEVERDPPQEVGIGAEQGRFDLHGLPLGGHEVVDRAPRFSLRRCEARAVAHHGERHGNVGALVAGEDRRLAPPERRDKPGAIRGGDLQVAALQEGLAGDIPRGAVGILGDHAKLLPPSGDVDLCRGRKDLDALHPRYVEIQLRPLFDPASQDLVGRLLDLREQSAGVWCRGRRLQEHQAVVGAGEVDATAGVVVGERPHVKDRIVAAERQLEAVLAFRGPVAGALIAAELREHRVDVANEVDVWPAANADHADRQGERDRGGAVAMDDAERALAVGERPEKAARAG